MSAYNNTGFTPDATGLHVNHRWGVGLPILISAFIGTLGFPVVLESGAVHAGGSARNVDIAHTNSLW